MKELRKFIAEHAMGLVFSVVVGTLCVLPQFLAPIALHGGYKGLEFLYIDDELTYRSLIQEVLDGHYTTASPHLYEYKDSPTIVYPTGVYFYALPAMLIGLLCVVVVAKFLFPAILFFLVYVLSRKLTGHSGRANIVNAVATGLMVTLGLELISVQYIKDLLTGGPHGLHLSLWTRLVNPVTGGLLLFGLFVSLWRVLELGKKRDIIISSILVALTVGYFFSLALSLATIVSLATVYALQKKWIQVKRILWVLVLTLVLQSPYWYNAMHALSGPEGTKLEGRNGMFFTHAPMLNKLLLATTIFFALSIAFAFWKKRKKRRIQKDIFSEHGNAFSFITALLLASWMVFNEQVVTGREIWPYHFVQYTIPVCFVVSLATFYLIWRVECIRFWKGVMVIIIMLALYSGITSAGSYIYRLDDFTKVQQSAHALEFLAAQPGKDCVVLVTDTDKTLERLIPAYTRCDVYSTGYNFYGIPEDRIIHNYLLGLRMQGVTAENIDTYLDTHDGEVRSLYYENWTQVFGHERDEWLVGRMQEVRERYKEFLKGNLMQQLIKYRVDYIFSSDGLSQQILVQLPNIAEMEVLNGVHVYAVSDN